MKSVYKQESSTRFDCGTITLTYQQMGKDAWLGFTEECDSLTEVNRGLSFAANQDRFRGHHVLRFGGELFPTGSYV